MTAEQYNYHLNRLAFLDPDNLLLRKLSEGHNLVNELLMAGALEKAENAEPVQIELDEWEEEDDPVEDETLKVYRTKLRKLFSERSRLSDHFHQCKNNTERANNSEEIQIIQRNISKTMQHVRKWKLEGILPDEESAKDYLPKDGLALKDKLLSLRANVSRQKKKVNDLEVIKSEDPAHQRSLEKVRDRLMELKRLKQNAEAAIKNLH